MRVLGEDISISLRMALRREDLPAPTEPTMDTSSPLRTTRLMFWRMGPRSVFKLMSTTSILGWLGRVKSGAVVAGRVLELGDLSSFSVAEFSTPDLVGVARGWRGSDFHVKLPFRIIIAASGTPTSATRAASAFSSLFKSMSGRERNACIRSNETLLSDKNCKAFYSYIYKFFYEAV